MAELVGVSATGPVRKTVVTLQICGFGVGQKCSESLETLHGTLGGSGHEGSRAPTPVSNVAGPGW